MGNRRGGNHVHLLGLSASLLGMCSFAWAASLPSPIAPAGQGQLQCYTPDVVRKTCRSLAAYKRTPDGLIDNTAIVLIAPNPALVMTTDSPVTIKAGQVCGFIQPNDIATAAFSLADRPATAEQTRTLQQKMQLAMKGIFGHEICTDYVPLRNSFRAKATVDGVAQPTMDEEVIWVQPTDGYKVSP